MYATPYASATAIKHGWIAQASLHCSVGVGTRLRCVSVRVGRGLSIEEVPRSANSGEMPDEILSFGRSLQTSTTASRKQVRNATPYKWMDGNHKFPDEISRLCQQ
jgi:hypothetical protein